MSIALITNYLSDYRVPLFKRLAERHDLEVLCYGGGAAYVPPWFADLDQQLREAPFPARRIRGAAGAFRAARRYDTVIAGLAGGAVLPATYAGARRFILWASVWAQPRSPAHALTLPLVQRIYRRSDSVVAYGEHVRSFVASIRGRDDDVFVAPQAVEAELFGRPISDEEIAAFRSRHGVGEGPLVLYVGRFVQEKGLAVLARAAPRVSSEATIALIGDGPQGAPPGTRALGTLPRTELPVAYAAASLTVVPSIPTPRFLEPWALVCNEAMHQARPVIASDAVGAVAGGLVRDGETGLVVPAGDAEALAGAINRLLADAGLRTRLGEAARAAVSAYTYDAMAEGFDRALAAAAR